MAVLSPIVLDSTVLDSTTNVFDAGAFPIANVPDNAQTLRLDTRPYRIRLVQPVSSFPANFDYTKFGNATPTTFMGKSYVGIELPLPAAPVSADLVQGVVNMRLNDSGDFQLTFPSALASSGVGRWKDLFSTSGHLQWVEIYRDDVIEFVGCVQQTTVGRDQIQVTGCDGMGLLKKWFENDAYLVAGPRDVISCYTRLPQVVVSDDFIGSTLSSIWTTSLSGSGTISQSNGYATIAPSALSSVGLGISTTFSALSDDWRITLSGNANPTSGVSKLSLAVINNATGYNVVTAVTPFLGTGTGNSNPTLTAYNLLGTFYDSNDGAPYSTAVPSFTITLEKKGRWWQYFFNGVMVGRIGVIANSLDETKILVNWVNAPASTKLNLSGIYVTSRVPFLETTSSDHGSYVLPGTQPYGGLLANYFVDTDLLNMTSTSTAPAWQGRVFSPDAKASKPTATRVDATINFNNPTSTWPLPAGMQSNYFSTRWTGSVYLALSKGNYTITAAVDDYCRIWIGQTRQSVDPAIIDCSSGGVSTFTGTVNAATLGAADGWYPIVVEYVQYPGTAQMQLSFTPPVAYTDPGGTAISTSSQIIPATSLSPNGVVEQRVQGQSAFDLVQQTAKDFGYSLYCEPYQLESGQFPGQLVARVREGKDTDVVLRTEDLDTDEPLISPQVTYDATALANVVRGSANGLQDGTGAPAQIEAYDALAMSSALFAIEAWQDAGDGANVQLLGARQTGVLSLSDSPWQNVTGTPRGIERLADSFPLTGTLSAMRWRPGDGVRVKIPEITVDDQTPRQILQVSRTFTGTGRTATSVGFRQRPRNPVETLRQMMRTVNYPNRIRKQQVITLSSTMYQGTLAGAANTGPLILQLNPNDQIQSVYLRVLINSYGVGLNIFVNGSGTASYTNVCGYAPTELDITNKAVRVSASDPRFYLSLTNGSATTPTGLNAQLIAIVLR